MASMIGAARRRAGSLARRSRSAIRLRWDLFASTFTVADVSVFHEFVEPPWGGGNQFLLALSRGFAEAGLRVETNKISRATAACLFNSFNFDFDRLRCFMRRGCRMVHRVDGPVQVYRDFDDGTDDRIRRINEELAEATVFQSEWSLGRHEALGYRLKRPVVIRNTVDPTIFHPGGRVSFDRERKVRLISSSWSDNPKKGGAIYRWLDDHIDRDRFEYTFVGRLDRDLVHADMVGPVGSRELAVLLRQHDIFVTASRDDPCSNSVLEALACGLPVLYLDSGGHPELVRAGGLGFESAEEIPDALRRLADEYEAFQAGITIPTLPETVSAYLQIMGVGNEGSGAGN